MVLVDTSIWIEVFRRRNPLDLEAVVDLGEVVTCLPIVQEVMQGFRDEAAFRIAREAMCSLPIVENPLRFEVFEEAVELYRTARRQGLVHPAELGGRHLTTRFWTSPEFCCRRRRTRSKP